MALTSEVFIRNGEGGEVIPALQWQPTTLPGLVFTQRDDLSWSITHLRSGLMIAQAADLDRLRRAILYTIALYDVVDWTLPAPILTKAYPEALKAIGNSLRGAGLLEDRPPREGVSSSDIHQPIAGFARLRVGKEVPSGSSSASPPDAIDG